MFNIQDIVSAPQTEMLLFYLIAIIAIPFAVGVIFDRNVIRSGFLLIGVFGGISALFLLLKAQFLALAQLMIYAVGITLVVVIALMLTSDKLNSEIASEEQDIENEPAIMQLIDKTKRAFPFVVAWLSFLTIYLSLRTEGWIPLNKAAEGADNLETIGTALTTSYSLPFEFASVLLLAALIGAIMLAKAQSTRDLDQSDIQNQE